MAATDASTATGSSSGALPARSERELMLAEEPYDSTDPELVELRRVARQITRRYNQTTEDEIELRTQILKEWFGSTGENIYIEPTFRCDYGSNIYVGNNFYMNFDCVILDVARVYIGENVMCGPKVQIYTATHPLEAKDRLFQDPNGVIQPAREMGKSIKIGSNVWLGGGCIICPGVTIGDNTTIAAGAVVTKDIPANSVAAGVPARVIRELPPWDGVPVKRDRA
eukprot:TRINITY_DN2400_c0_g4_i1.p1 TRINITY_DN2400_c0_g4~~TRINITY_DN2400_c0_g4_i1.p1  ORF type:complete len:239 (-),score=54.35 TRINITY_DN2400_c0_g4_i1:110-784(-)